MIIKSLFYVKPFYFKDCLPFKTTKSITLSFRLPPLRCGGALQGFQIFTQALFHFLLTALLLTKNDFSAIKTNKTCTLFKLLKLLCEKFNFLPISVFNFFAGICFSTCDFHNQANHCTIKKNSVDNIMLQQKPPLNAVANQYAVKIF